MGVGRDEDGEVGGNAVLVAGPARDVGKCRDARSSVSQGRRRR